MARRGDPARAPRVDRARTGGRALTARAVAVALALALALVALYLPSLDNGFVDWDDSIYVVRNPNVAGLTAETIAWAFTEFESANWHPLTWISHALDRELWGLDARAHHRTSLVLHALNGALLLLLATRLSGRLAAGLAAAALWAFHPMRVEAVTWVSERKELLCAAFLLAALLAWERHIRRGGRAAYVAAVALHAAALLAKPMAISLPLLLLALDLWPFRRLGHARHELSLLTEKLPFFVLSAASTMITFAAQRGGDALRAGEAIPVAERLGNAAVSSVAYVAKTLWPAPGTLLPLYTHPHFLPDGLDAAKVAGAGAVILAVAVLAWRRRRTYPEPLFALTGYLVVLAPVLGLVQVGVQRSADRYSYLSLIPPLVALSALADTKLAGRRRRLAGGVVLLAVGIFAALTWRQQSVWSDSLTLWRHTVDGEPESPVARLNLGNALHELGRGDEAFAETRRAVALNPGWSPARAALGARLGARGELEAAISELRTALALRPDDAFARSSLGNALLQRGRVEEGLEELASAVERVPSSVLLRNAFARALTAVGRTDEAGRQYEAVLRLEPRSPAAHNNLASSLLSAGRAEEGIALLRRALELDPRYEIARRNLEQAITDREGVAGGSGAGAAAPPDPASR